MAELLNYEELRDSINNRTTDLNNRLDTMPPDMLRGLLRELLAERRLVVEEVDEIRESRNRWLQDFRSYVNSMTLMVSDIDDESYNMLQSKASRLGLTPGKLLNELMWKASSKSEGGSLPEISSGDIIHLRRDENVIKIQHLPSIQVSRDDLLKLEHKVKFAHIKAIEFCQDVDVELFNIKVKAVNHCSRVVFPPGVGKLLAYAKAGFCREYVFNENVAGNQSESP
jgi:hypothetical protein